MRVRPGTVQYGGMRSHTPTRVRGSTPTRVRGSTPEQTRTGPSLLSTKSTQRQQIDLQPVVDSFPFTPAKSIVIPGNGTNDIYSMTLVGQIFAYVHQKKPSDKCVQYSKIITIRGEGPFHVNQKSWEATLSTLKVAQALTQF